MRIPSRWSGPHIRLRSEFVYLAVVLDGFSRRVIGWALGRALEAGLAVTALRWRCSSGSRRPAWCTAPTEAYSMKPVRHAPYVNTVDTASELKMF